MTAAEAYRKTVAALNGEYAKDHEEIMASIEDACAGGEYSVSFEDDEYDDMEKHMKDLEADGFRVKRIADRRLDVYVVSWEHASNR